MRRLMTVALAAGLVLAPGAAWADHDYGGYDDRRGDCRGSEGHCEDNDLSPSFQDSPVRDAFNFSPAICLPGSTCHFDGRGDGQQGGGQR
jgi:hypothetical protein